MGLLDIFKNKGTEPQEVIEDVKEEVAQKEDERSTKGWIYIISNVGSFGPNIYKIGMTKAKNPMTRIKDLSDASVPFNFAVHGLIEVDDVGSAEAQIHRFLRDKEVNKINHKKEFFNISLEEIKDIIKKLGYKVKWDDDAVDINYLKSKEKSENK